MKKLAEKFGPEKQYYQKGVKMWELAPAASAYSADEWKQRDFDYHLPSPFHQAKTLKTTCESEPSHSHPVSENLEHSQSAKEITVNRSPTNNPPKDELKQRK